MGGFSVLDNAILSIWGVISITFVYQKRSKIFSKIQNLRRKARRRGQEKNRRGNFAGCRRCWKSCLSLFFSWGRGDVSAEPWEAVTGLRRAFFSVNFPSAYIRSSEIAISGDLYILVIVDNLLYYPPCMQIISLEIFNFPLIFFIINSCAIDKFLSEPIKCVALLQLFLMLASISETLSNIKNLIRASVSSLSLKQN